MITRNEWLAALDEANTPPPQDPNVLTVREFADLLGIGRDAAGDRIALLVKAGKAERVTKVIRNVSGSLVKVPAYRLLKKKKP